MGKRGELFVTLLCWSGASDTGESSLGSATRARRKDSGKQEACGRNALTESSHRQFNTSQEHPCEQAGAKAGLLVQHHTQERSIDLKSAVVLNETQLAEFVHEKIDP